MMINFTLKLSTPVEELFGEVHEKNNLLNFEIYYIF